MADILRRRGLRVYLDPGYDLHVYAGNFGRPFGGEARFFPEWVHLFRILGNPLPHGYTAEVVEQLRIEVSQGKWEQPPGRSDSWFKLHAALRHRIVRNLRSIDARALVIENGTLPENPLVTEALFDAIEIYGRERGFGRYVLWRDFDLMWSVEPSRYGPFPYRGVPRLRSSSYIQHVVGTEWMRRRVADWVPSVPVAVLPNRFPMFHSDLCPRNRFRAAYGISRNAILIARCTRVIPQKCIERDIRLIGALQDLLRGEGDSRAVFLFITGPMDEDQIETTRLKALTRQLSLEKNIIWGDGLLPFNPLVRQGFGDVGYSVADLLHASNLSSFLTSYDFEGFGNPPGEAMAMRIPYIASSYELYHEVYGRRGSVAPLLAIDRSDSCSNEIGREFVSEVLRLLLDVDYKRKVVRNNTEVCRAHFSFEQLEVEVEQLLQVDASDRL